MKLKLQDLIDMKHFQNLQDRLNEIYSFPSSIIDNEGIILTATGWQDICTQFHRKNKDCERECIKSDQYILSHLNEANPTVSYRCPHGLVDNATPIIIDNIHYGNFFTGQFFLEKPDLKYFRGQAKKYGFDEDAYIRAVKKVPIWTQEQLSSYISFIKELIAIISEKGFKRLKEIEIRNQIEESLEQHRMFLQTAMDGFLMTDMQGHILEVNVAYCRMSGYSKKELLAMSISNLEAVETNIITADHIHKLKAQGEERFESLHRRKDGSIFDVEVSVQYHPKGGGWIVAFLRDITDRKRAEEELRERENTLKEAQRLAHIGSWEWTVATDTVKWSQELYYINGRDPNSSAPGYKEMSSCYTQESWERLSAVVTNALHNKESYEIDLDIMRKDGTIIHTFSRGEIDCDASGKVIGLHGTVQDITERKRIEKERENALIKAQNEKNKTEAIIAALPDGIIIQDTDYNITYQSPIQSEIYGEHVGEHCYKVYEGRDTICEDCPVERTFVDGKVHRSERCVRTNDNISHIELTSSPLKDSSGKIIAGIKLVRDITKRKLAEEKIRSSLKEKEILLKEIHHRVKNNMQIISSLLGLASINIKDETFAEMFRDSQNRINSMALIHENLYRSKDLAKIDLNDYIRDLADNLFHSREIAGRIELFLNIENVSLGIDLAIPCGLIINELITNSLKHAFPGDRNGQIKVSAHCKDENMVELIFSDNGVGIPSNIDFRNTKSLGLHLVTMLSEVQLHGKINLDRTAGTEFKIIFKGVK